ncbi:Uma2 family endonuclease [Chroococcus sp. FPU101]|uniref:Uma2 family endonuclease n=1 Tax=Chroococcus sp. FPU101 TaxID=1974212 RepID=UPI001A8EF557|nr:Uma2 family endonuclease [Chroococcus sp. FPU101]GFE67978.1 hypothetical protein CFPU101_05880 [Chroococcus sp. FPU101]
MNQTTSDQVYWTVHDLELLPDNPWLRYEIIDGVLLVTRAPHWNHQTTCGRFFQHLNTWSETTGLGKTTINPGVLFSEADNVIPDVVWATQETYDQLIDEKGHLTGAPELVIEVLSESQQDQNRDRETKLKLYSTRGVREYWIADWRVQKLEIYRRDNGQLKLVTTLFSEDIVTSPLLPGFSCVVKEFFP